MLTQLKIHKQLLPSYKLLQSVHTTQADVDSAKQNVEQAKDNVKFVNDSWNKQAGVKRIQPSKNAQDNIKVSENADTKRARPNHCQNNYRKAGVDDELWIQRIDTAEIKINVSDAKLT